MYKNVEMAARAALRFAHEARAALLERGNAGGEIGHEEGDVMQTFAALGEEAAIFTFLYIPPPPEES